MATAVRLDRAPEYACEEVVSKSLSTVTAGMFRRMWMLCFRLLTL